MITVYVENNIDIVEMQFASFNMQVEHEITTEAAKPIDYECLCGKDTTQDLDLPDGSIADYIKFFDAIRSLIYHGKPAIVKKVVYEPKKIKKTLIVVTMVCGAWSDRKE